MDLTTLFATLALCVFSGCGGGQPVADGQTALREPVTVRVEGPWASPSTVMRVRTDGTVVAHDGRHPAKRFRLSPAELGTVGALSELSFDRGGRRFPMRCLDCFIYEISVGGERRILDQVALETSPADRRLVATIVRATPGEVVAAGVTGP